MNLHSFLPKRSHHQAHSEASRSPCADRAAETGLTPRISIVMPTKNASEYIERALQSFVAQDWEKRELIVVDGGSKDETLDLVHAHADPQRDIVYLLSDRNATEAVVRGVELSTGDVVGLLMSDDWLEPGALSAVAARFQADPSLELVCAGARMWEAGGKQLELVTDVPAAGDAFTLQRLLEVPYTAAYFYRRSLWERLGGFVADYHYGADRDFIVRSVLTKARSATISAYSYNYFRHEGSATLIENGPVVEKFLADHRRMARRWLQFADVDTQTKALITAWRRHETLHLARRKILNGGMVRGLALMAPEAIRRPSVALEGARLLAFRARRIGA